ncbi:MAG: hypothetical protein JNM31_01505 [Flavobacteriales bacterium]|nr:hypothetical protein [Flavobacteriales bacterium]
MAHTPPPPSPDQPEAEPTPPEEGSARCYRALGRDLTFCPLKDLNLPGSYAEVVERLRKLQAERAMETLN